MMVTAIEAKEQRSIAVGDVKGAFLILNIPDFTTVKFINEQVDILCRIYSNYKKHVTHEGKNKVLHVVLNTSLCGAIQAALL